MSTETITAFRQQLLDAHRKGQCVHIERSGRINEYTNGFVHGVGERDLVLMQAFGEFQADGYQVLRLADIKTVRNGEHERFLERVLADDQAAAKPLPDVDFSNWRSLLLSLQELEWLVAIFYEDPRFDEDELLVGLVSEIDGNSVWVQPCTAVATWEGEEVSIKQEAVTSVEIDTPYVRVLAKYLGLPPIESKDS